MRWFVEQPIVLLMTCLMSFAWGSPGLAAKRPLEIYSAIEGEESPRPKRNKKIVHRRTTRSRPSPGRAAAPAMASSPAYDPVPSDQANPIAKRLKLIELLIVR